MEELYEVNTYNQVSQLTKLPLFGGVPQEEIHCTLNHEFWVSGISVYGSQPSMNKATQRKLAKFILQTYKSLPLNMHPVGIMHLSLIQNRYRP